MRLHYTKIVILVIVASLAISAAYASTYTVVKPSAMNGWVLATLSSANPIPGYKGISTGFVDPKPRGLFTDVPVLPGAFYATLGGYGSTTAAAPNDYVPGQVWLGTNAYNGVALDRIKDIQYHAWMTGLGLWNKNDKYFAPPRQPVGLRLVIKEADPSTVTHMLIWRPWAGGSPDGFGNNAYYPDDTQFLEAWKTHYPITGGLWLEFTYNPPGYPTTPCNWTGDWAAVKLKYSGATITTPALQPVGTQGGEWPEAQPVNTPNACGVSLQWGAEAQAGVKSVSDGQPYMPYINWWRETWGGIAYVDCFEITLDDLFSYDTYDFEADAPGHLVASNTSGTQDSTGGKAPYYSHLNMEFKAFGKVISKALTSPHLGLPLVASPNANEFVLDDGGIQIRVFCPGCNYTAANVGEYHAVTGKLMPSYMMYLSGEPRHMRLHATTDEIE